MELRTEAPETARPGRFRLLADLLWIVLVGAAAFAVYLRTTAPSVVELFDDSLEFPLVADRLAIPHPTGYPLYAILAKIFSWLPFGELAFRVNLLSAVCAALAVAAIVALVGEILLLTGRRTLADRIASAVAALCFAVTPVFWSQAVVAEVYALAALLALLTSWAVFRAVRLRTDSSAGVAALFVGLGLVHHRTFILLLPALAVAVWLLTRPAKVEAPEPEPEPDHQWSRAGSESRPVAVNFADESASESRRPLSHWRRFWPVLLPLLLYLYLPLRGGVGSIDGTYRNDPLSILRWITGLGYSAFFGDNALARQGDPLTRYTVLVLDQFGPVGLTLATVGLGWSLWRLRPVAAWLVLWFLAGAGFAVLYRVADPEVFALLSFLPVAVSLGLGLAAVARVIGWLLRSSAWPRVVRGLAATLPLIVVLVVPVRAFAGNYETADRSIETTVRAYGIDALNQPIPASGGIVGLLGEASLFHYLQRAQGLRADLAVRAADAEPDRLAAIELMLGEGREVYLTRPLEGLAERYALAGAGPLIAVERTPTAQLPPSVRRVDRSFGDVDLLAFQAETIFGYALGPGGPSDLRSVHRTVRVTLYWQVTRRPAESLRSFVHLTEPLGDRWAQSDSVPVRGAYPTTRWRPGTIVIDIHDLALPLGTPPGDYTLFAGLAKPDGGSISSSDGSREARLGQYSLDSRPGGYTPRRLDLEPAYGNFGNLTMIGRRISPEPIRPAAMVTVESLWRAEREISQSLAMQAELMGPKGAIPLGSGPIGGRFSTVRWAVGELIRDRQSWRLPADLVDGEYQLRVSVADGPRQPFGTVQVIGRPHTFTLASEPAFRSGARLGGRAELVGWSAAPARVDAPNDAVEITLTWRAAGALDGDYTVFVHFLGSTGVVLAQHDGEPMGGNAPTASWLANEIIVDKHVVRMPTGVAPESLRLAVGLYEPKSGRRLTGPRNSDRLDLGVLRFG